MKKDIKILRKLAYDYHKIAYSDKNAENIKLHRAVNDLNQLRPVVLIDELPWSEMNIDKELTLQCTDLYLREIEWFFRSNIYKNKYMPADMIVPSFIPIQKIIHSSGYGISTKEEILHKNSDNNITAHKYFDILQTDEDLGKLHCPVISYDKKETMKNYQLVGDILGDILPSENIFEWEKIVMDLVKN